MIVAIRTRAYTDAKSPDDFVAVIKFWLMLLLPFSFVHLTNKYQAPILGHQIPTRCWDKVGEKTNKAVAPSDLQSDVCNRPENSQFQ